MSIHSTNRPTIRLQKNNPGHIGNCKSSAFSRNILSIKSAEIVCKKMRVARCAVTDSGVRKELEEVINIKKYLSHAFKKGESKGISRRHEYENIARAYLIIYL